MELIFEAGNMNDKGICRGWVCDWVVRCKGGENIRSRYDLSSGHRVEGLFNTPPLTNDGIDGHNHLVPLTTVVNTAPPINPIWIATELTKGTGHFIFGVRGRSLNVGQGRYNYSGHALGTRKGYGKLQFFDPNTGLMEFDNTLGFFDYLPRYLRTTYPGLLTLEAEVKKF